MGHSQMVFDVQRGRVLEGRTKAARVPFTTMGFQVVNQCRHVFSLLLAVKTAEIHQIHGKFTNGHMIAKIRDIIHTKFTRCITAPEQIPAL